MMNEKCPSLLDIARAVDDVSSLNNAVGVVHVCFMYMCILCVCLLNEGLNGESKLPISQLHSLFEM